MIHTVVAKKETIQFQQLLAMPDLALSNLAVFRGSDEDFEVRACAQDFVSAIMEITGSIKCCVCCRTRQVER